MTRGYPVTLTGGQLRVTHELLAVVLNDPDWPVSDRDRGMMARADEAIMVALRAAWRAESTPA